MRLVRLPPDVGPLEFEAEDEPRTEDELVLGFLDDLVYAVGEERYHELTDHLSFDQLLELREKLGSLASWLRCPKRRAISARLAFSPQPRRTRAYVHRQRRRFFVVPQRRSLRKPGRSRRTRRARAPTGAGSEADPEPPPAAAPRSRQAIRGRFAGGRLFFPRGVRR